VRGLRAASHLELRQDARDVVLDRLLGQVELLADLPVRLAVGHEREDALLLRGQAGELLVPQQVLALAEPVEHRARHGGVQEAFATTHRADRPDELAPLHLLQHVSGRPGHDRGEQSLVVGERGQHHDRGLRVLRADLARRLDPAAVDEADVHDHDVRARPVGLVDRLADRPGLSRHDDVVGGLQEGADTAANDLVVVDEEYAERRFCHGPTS
jgi:hypothetical protein